MFNPHFRLGAPRGGDLLAELGIDPMTVHEIADDERAIRCPDRVAAYPERSFASLDPEPSPDRDPGQAMPLGLHEAATDDLWDPAPARRPAGRRWRRA